MRSIVYPTLSTYAPLLAVVGDDANGDPNIHQASSLTVTPPRPFVTFRMHTDFPLRPRGTGAREYIQLWAHDDPGDYTRIDDILSHCRDALEAAAHSGTFLEARWIETGVDLKDDVMHTITRYMRFQLTRTLRSLA